MSVEGIFDWRIERDEAYDLYFIVLNRSGGTDEKLETWIAPRNGSNLCRFAIGGDRIIDFDGLVLANHGYTGTPVLYPTPNRVRSGIFRYQGKLYNQIKNGESVFEHGLVHNEAWEYSEPVIEGDSIVLQTWIDFNDSSPFFKSFPFLHRLGLAFRLKKNGLSITYSIDNKGIEDIPYGFGLHPYFMKLCGEEGTLITVPVTQLMDYTSDLLPTGRLIETEGTIYNLRKPVSIGNLDLDHVFTGIIPGVSAEVLYPAKRLKVILETTPDFSHIVIYSPRGENYFCIENQTCSTDAHNLFDRGFLQASGLKLAKAGELTQGTIEYRLERLL